MRTKKKWPRRALILAIVSVAWFAIGTLLNGIFGPMHGDIDFQLFAPDVKVGNIVLSEAVLATFVVTGIIILLAVLLRIFVVSKLTDVPTNPLQNILEFMIDGLNNFSERVSGVRSSWLNRYMFGLSAFLLVSATTDLVKVRPPTADLRVTGLLAIITFFLLNYYGFKKKKFKGRIKSLASPSPIIFPIRVLSDLATPVSLACRLFGNMVGGMIIMELLYMALGNFALLVPSIFALYFSIFEPLIQVYIFVTLTLSYIHEAVE